MQKTIIRAYKLKLIPSKEQEQLFNSWLWVCRRLYNAIMLLKIDDLERKSYVDTVTGKRVKYNKDSKYLSNFDISNKITKLKKELPELTEVHSHVLQDVSDRVFRSYDNFFRGAGYPNPAYVRTYKSFTFKSGACGKVKSHFPQENRLRLPNIGLVRFHKDRTPPLGAKIKNIIVSKRTAGWFTSVVVEEVISYDPTAPEAEVGIDMGVANFMALSSGEVIPNPRFAESNATKLAKLQKNLSRKVGSKKGQKKSNRFKKAASRVAKLQAKIANSRLDYQHKETTKIVDRFQKIVVEDLSLKNMTKSAKGTKETPGKNVAQKRGLNRSLNDVALYQTRQLLEYKAKQKDREFVVVDPRYTSQTCSQCGCVSKNNRKSQAGFLCIECGFQKNADINAAINILAKA